MLAYSLCLTERCYGMTTSLPSVLLLSDLLVEFCVLLVDAVEAPVVVEMSRADVAVHVSRIDTRELSVRDQSIAWVGWGKAMKG